MTDFKDLPDIPLPEPVRRRVWTIDELWAALDAYKQHRDAPDKHVDPPTDENEWGSSIFSPDLSKEC